ncbi:MAG: hypothetical protein PWQ12_1154, partial [Clostridiales bacterium]|nr:hypothetical protein [Clostridiales bacterium]
QAHEQYSFLTFHPLTGPLSEFGITSGSFYVNGREFFLDADNTDMQGLAKMIDEANLNVNARINESGQLELKASHTGTDYEITSSDGASNIMTVMNLQTNKEARDARFNFGGQEYVSSKNTVTEIQEITERIVLAVQHLTGSASEILHYIESHVLKDYDYLVSVGEDSHDNAVALNDIISEFSATSQELLASMQNVSHAMTEIATATSESAHGATEIAHEASEIAEMSIRVNTLAENARLKATRLKETVAQFTV